MNEVIERIYKELDELEHRIDGLKSFLFTDAYDHCSFIYRDLCYRQLTSMREYHHILSFRLELLERAFREGNHA